MPRPSIARPALPRALARAGLGLMLVLAVAGCRATTELGPPQATPDDMGGIAAVLQTQGVYINDLVSGEAGCPDPNLAKAAITFQAFGLDQTTPVTVHFFIFDDDAAYQRARPSVDTCSKSFVTDPSTYEALDQSPYVAVGQGPWGTKFMAAIRAGLAIAAKGG